MRRSTPEQDVVSHDSSESTTATVVATKHVNGLRRSTPEERTLSDAPEPDVEAVQQEQQESLDTTVAMQLNPPSWLIPRESAETTQEDATLEEPPLQTVSHRILTLERRPHDASSPITSKRQKVVQWARKLQTVTVAMWRRVRFFASRQD
uniref:Uncharacterized protein n=1 Tax=Entomoneis paludosa TaxID=265537 RepID=A0A7S2YD71_9STRA